MEKKIFIKHAKRKLFSFLLFQGMFILLLTLFLSAVTLFYNVLVAIGLLFSILMINYLLKKDSYSEFSLYKTLYFSVNLEKNLIFLILLPSIINYFIIPIIDSVMIMEISGFILDDFEFEIKRSNSLLSSILFSIIVSVINFNILNNRFRDIIEDKIYNSKYYFKRIKDRQQSPLELKKYLLKQSETSDFWFVSEKNEEDLVNDLFYRGYLE